VAGGFELGEAAELDVGEVAPGGAVDQEAAENKEGARDIGVGSVVERVIAPGPEDECGEGDVEDPQGEDEFIGAASVGAPVLGEGVEGEPEERDGAVDGAEEEGEGLEVGEHVLILFRRGANSIGICRQAASNQP
jgi:hypothetical protein